MRPALGTRLRLGDVALVVGVVALVVFPVASRLAADAQPVAPVVGVRLAPLRVLASVHQVRGLPVFRSMSSAEVDSLAAGGGAAELLAINIRLRDLFGAHTYQRVDKDGSFHVMWGEDEREVEA